MLLDYRARSDLELTLKKGDIITNIDKKGKLWWKGELHGRRGKFPSLLVEENKRHVPESSVENSADKTAGRLIILVYA